MRRYSHQHPDYENTPRCLCVPPLADGVAEPSKDRHKRKRNEPAPERLVRSFPELPPVGGLLLLAAGGGRGGRVGGAARKQGRDPGRSCRRKEIERAATTAVAAALRRWQAGWFPSLTSAPARPAPEA